ncbi:MAG: TonB-dependent receptor, partial [Flavobacteriales bacterium]
NGGVMLFTPRLAPRGTFATELSEQIGGFGMFRLGFSAAKSGEKNSFRISYVDQSNRGYREQERNARRQLSLYLKQQLTEDQSLTFYGTYYHGGWELPGALTAAQVEDNPRQAVAYSKDQDAELARKRWMGGLNYQWKIRKHFKQQIAIYAYSTLKENPYGTSSGNSGYKDEGADGFGGRANWQWSGQRKKWWYELRWGGEWQTEKYNILESKLVNSQPGDFKYLYDIGYITAMGFASGDFSWGNHITLQCAASNNAFTQDARGFTSNGFVFDTTMTLKSQWLPRLAIQTNWLDGFHVFAAWSKGNSNPTAFEAIDQENNSYNLQLTPEQGENLEFGLKHRTNDDRLYYELSVYDFRLSRAILPYNYVVNDSTSFTRYHNDGNTVQRGLEWLVQWEAMETDVMQCQVWTSGAVNAYRFRNYLLDGTNYADKWIAGTPLAMASSGIQWQWKNRFSVNVIHQWYDRTPLNNVNSVWSNPYQLVHLKCAYSLRLKRMRWFDDDSDSRSAGAKISIYGGVNNMLNTGYSAYFQYNAFGGKFYNPAPSINAYVGVSWGY